MGNFDGVIMSVLNNRRAAKKDPKKRVTLFGSSGDSQQQDDDKPKDINDVFKTGTSPSLARRFGSTNNKRIEDQM
jgi:hypothetical protein